jgi:hypothetical protein
MSNSYCYPTEAERAQKERELISQEVITHRVDRRFALNPGEYFFHEIDTKENSFEKIPIRYCISWEPRR